MRPVTPSAAKSRPASADDAHRPLQKQHDLASILSHVETRQVKNDYTIQCAGKIYAIDRADVCPGLRGAVVRVEQRRDESVAIRFGEKYLRHQRWERPMRLAPQNSKPAPRSRQEPNAGGKSTWMKGFMKKAGPSIEKAIAIANATS